MARVGVYRLTPSRRAALRKAQLISARKRKGRRKAAIGVLAAGGVALVGAAAYGRHKRSGSSLYMRPSMTDTPMMDIGGRKVPGTKVGIRRAKYGSGYAVTVSARIPFANKDIHILSYRHKPLTRYALLGRKVKKAENLSQPERLPVPQYADPGTYQWANSEPLSEANANRRNIYQWENSNARTAYNRKGIGGVEAIRRLRKYENALKKRGLAYNREHVDMVFKRMLEEGV